MFECTERCSAKTLTKQVPSQILSPECPASSGSSSSPPEKIRPAEEAEESHEEKKCSCTQNK